MKKLLTVPKFLLLISCLLLVGMLAFQLYNYLFLSLHIEYAMEASMEDSFEVSGIVCRTEKVIAPMTTGYSDIIRETGDKVSGGGTIADVYSQAADVRTRERIRRIDTLISEYSAAVMAMDSYSGDSTNYDLQIRSALERYVSSVQTDAPRLALDALNDFEKSVYIKQIVSGQAEDYQAKIEGLRAEKETLQASMSGNVSQITTDVSGYFCKSTDGYEDDLVIDALKTYDVSAFNELYARLTAANASETESIGKIIPDYTWQFYFIASSNALQQYHEGKQLSLRFSAASDSVISATITSMKTEGDQCLVGVECANLEPELLSERILEASVILQSYSGIRVDKDSLRIVDGDYGVYVKVGSVIRFRKVKVLYTGTTYALIEKGGAVENFDAIIVDGKNIYDGKIVS